MPRPTAIAVMFGYSDANDVRRLVQEARLAATEDLLGRVAACGWDRVIFCSNRPDALEAPPSLVLERISSTSDPFHFGREIQSLVQRCGLEDHGVLYVGGGLPLLTAATMELMRGYLAEGNNVAITNNIHSCDFIGWSPGAAVGRIVPPDTDNDLAWQLRRAGVEVTELPRSAETTFDVDTPTDLALLSLAPTVGPRMAALLARAPIERVPLQGLMAVLRSFDDTVLCYGRISHHSWAYFAQRAACQTRIISEERGMRASGRLARGEVRSLLGFLADQSGFPATFRMLSQLAGGLILDTRVLMAHCRQWPSTEDRFNADLGRVEEVRDAWLRDMTQAALDCGVPVVMGGHCLVSGGLYLLGDAVGPKEIPLA
ncbi:MAG: hypothetical protein HPY83_10465 [Anaerolineae bacterium]|nr:hypothetical protein [Anaerolineae bacterium]